jgi:hypothetical protein
VLVLVLISHASHLLYVSVQEVGVDAVTHVFVGSGGMVLQPGLPLHSGHWQSQDMVLFWGLQSTHWLYVIVQDVGVATSRHDGVGGETVLQPGLPSTDGHVVGHWQSYEEVSVLTPQPSHLLYVMVHVVGVATEWQGVSGGGMGVHVGVLVGQMSVSVPPPLLVLVLVALEAVVMELSDGVEVLLSVDMVVSAPTNADPRRRRHRMLFISYINF